MDGRHEIDVLTVGTLFKQLEHLMAKGLCDLPVVVSDLISDVPCSVYTVNNLSGYTDKLIINPKPNLKFKAIDTKHTDGSVYCGASKSMLESWNETSKNQGFFGTKK